MSALPLGCPGCPLNAAGLGCAGHVMGNTAICGRMAEDHPHRAETIRRQTVLAQRHGWTPTTPRRRSMAFADSDAVLAVVPTNDLASSRPVVEHADTMGLRAKLAEVQRLTALVNACPHRGCRISCQSAACSAGKGDRNGGREATLRHCMGCVAAALTAPTGPSCPCCGS